MLFNKHSETKQRFGIRKLTIGACSVLLSTLFLTVNNGQNVNAATGDTVTNADNNKTETDNESVTKENEANKTNNDSSVSLNKGTTKVTNTSNGTDSTEKQTTETEIEDKSADATTNGSAKADDTKATEDKSADNIDQKTVEDKAPDSNDQKSAEGKATSSDTEKQSDKTKADTTEKVAVNKLAVNKLTVNKLTVNKLTVNNLAAKVDDSTPVLSQSTENGDMTLSISLPELSNKDYIPQTIKLNATNVNSGDKIVIKVKKGSAYGFKKENFPIGTVKESDQGDYRMFELDINTTGKFEYKISATRNNNYLAQPSPMEDTGVTTKDIQWSINGEDQAPLSFKQTIIPELISNGVSLATATGDKNTDFTEVAPNEDYNFVYVMGENDGLVHDGSYMAGVVNSAVNYGTTITIPVPENFLLNQEASDKANKERGLTGFTMTQDGMGKDVIITVPKGQSGLAWNHRGVYYTLTGKFVYDQIPEEPTTVATKRDSVIDQIYTSDGQRITAKGKPFSVTISGKKARPASGPLSLSVSGAISNNQLLLDSNPNNDPVAVNWFGYSNNYDDIENAKIKLDLADGLYVTGIKTPKDLGTVYNNIGNIQSYTYEMTLTNGQKITGTVKAGDIAKSTVTTTDADNKQTIIGIRNIVFTPDTNTIGKDTKTDDIPKPGSIADQEDRIDGTKTSNVFIALGHLSHTYDNGSQVKANDKLTSSITIFGSNFRPDRYNNNPILSYTARNIQTVFDTSQYKASLSAYNDPNYTSTQPGKENAGTISLNNGDGRSNYDYIFEPIFYYVVPDNAVYSGGTIRNLNHNGNDRPEPVVSTYFVNGHQVVKLDYSNTNYYYNTKSGVNEGIPLDNANNQPSNTSSWEIYAYSKDIPLLNNSYTSGKFLTPENAEKSGSTVKLDPSKFYYVGGGTWTINTASATVLADAANGNKNSDGLYVQNGTSDDKGSDGMNFRVNVVNYDMTTDLKDLTGFINLPVKGYNNTTTNFFLSGPVDVPDGTVLYSTSSTDLPSGKGAKTPSTDNFLTKEQVEAKIASGQMSWSDVKSIAVKYDTVKANSATKDIYIHGKDPDITTDAGKVAQISWGLYGGNGMSPLVKKNASSIVISGSSTVKTRLHYIDPKGKDQYVDVPTMSKTYKDNSDTMRDSDFNDKNIPASLIPQGYELVLQNENGKAVAVKSIIDNGGKTWVTDAKDGSAQFGKLVLYNFDGDTVQFELTPKIDKATQTVNRTVHFVSDGDNPQKLANDVYETAKITELTNEVTGEKQYSATITAGGVTTDAPVVVGQDGQISISFPATTIPEVNKYYVVDSTKSEAGAISPTFTFTKDGELPIVNTVKYAPVKQELQVKVYDDDADDPSQALDTTKTGATVKFIGNSETAFPTDLKTNLETLKKYYEDKNYIVTLPVATGNFDNTPNGSGSDEQIQVLEVHLTHAKDVKTEYAKAVRNITYEGAGKQTPATKSDTFDNAFSRTITTDKVTGKVTISVWIGSHTFKSVNSPSVEGYHPDKASAGNIEATANSLNTADKNTLAELLKTGVVVSDHVTYSPDKQEVKIRVYDDTTGSELNPVTAQTDIRKQGKDVEINLSGTSNEIIPTEFGNNIDLLKEYYQSKGYKFISHTSVPQHFDQTSNGSSETDSNPQYIDIHLEHDLSLEKETKTVTRTINYYDQDKKQLINDANNKVTEPQTVVQEVDFARYAVRDKVTSQIIGYATPDQVTVKGDHAQLTKKNGYTPVTGKASDAGASYVVTSTDSKFASQTNYDLSKYGYEAPTTEKGDSFAQVDELTPLPTDDNSIVNVYYGEKVVTVTVDDPPTVGKKVPGTDAEFPPNKWSKDDATSTSTRTIHYVYDDNTFANGVDVSGQAVPGLNDIIQKVNFAQSAKINLVTGDVSYQGDWNAISSTTTNQQGEEVVNQGNGRYAKVVSPSSKNGYPELKGYTAHQEVVNASQATHGVDVGQVLVKYTANDSLVQIEYVDQDTGLALKVDTKNGKSGETFDYSTTDTIADYEKSGYELVHDGFTENDGNLNNKTFDSYDDVPDSQRPETINQKWKVTLKHKKITVTNDDPKDPDGKITTDKGYDHNYPTGVSETDLNNTVRRNISFIYTDKPEGNNQAYPTKTQEVAYKRQATIDLVKLANGDSDAVSYSNWEPKEAGKESFDSYQVKPIEGYVANYELVPSADVHKDQDGKAENGQDVVVKYSPVGKIIPIDKDGNEIPNAPTPEYNNDPTNPTKTTTTDVPEIPGYHAEVPNVTPDNPLEDTKVVYVKNTQVIDLVYVDTKTNTTLTTQNDVAHGDSGSTIPTSVTDTLNSTIQSYLDKGYVIAPDKVSGTVPDTFDFSDQAANGADKEHQVVTIYLTHGTVTVTGNDPKTPGKPINPEDPNGSKYPSDVSKDNLVISSQNIIHYYDEAGNKIRDDKVTTDDNTLTREVIIDKVTGDVISTGKWTGGKKYENVNTPVVNGYYTDRASAGASTVTPADADPNSGRVHNGVITNETTVIYHPMGHIIPIDKSGNKIPGAETPIFNNDPKDPTKASTTNSPIIPGYHLETPSDSAITPDEPGTNRLVVYVADTQELKVQVFDLDGDTPDEPLKTDKTGATVDFTGDSFTNFPSDVATNVDSLIKYYTDRGYLVKTKPSDEELSGKFDGDKTQTQYLKLQLVHDKTTVSGEDENTPVPDTLINENDPDSVKYPSDVSKDNLVISSEVIIHYEGAGEKTPKDVIRTVDKTLTRAVTIDKVTGKVTNTSNWSSNTTEYKSVLTPQIQGYTSDKVQVDKVSITKDNAGEAKNGKITYTFNVIYTPDKQQLILKVHDEDTQSYLGDPVIFDGYTDQEVGNSPVDKLEELKKKYLDLGYGIVETPRLDKNYDDTPNVGGEPDKKPQVFVLKVKHRIVPVTPDDPKTPDDIIPDSNQNYPGGLTETDLSRTITRTIIVHYPSGTNQEIKQVVTYTRTATVDAVTKEVKYSAWTTKNSNWPKYVAPVVPGYTPDKDMIELTYVPADGKDVTIEINYTADPEPDEPRTPVKPGEPITPVKPGEPITPVTPTKPTTPTKPVKPTKPSKPKKPAKQTKPEVVKPVKETKGKQLYGSAQAKVDSKAAQNVVDKNKANGTNDKKLPQTNGESNWQLSLLGVGVLALALLVLKKKRDDE